MARLTKKMLSVLDRAEIRKLATLGMGMPMVDAYRTKLDEVVTWIHGQPDKLAEVDIEAISQPVKADGSSGFRDGVIMYISQLQGFIRKENPAPEWPPTEDVHNWARMEVQDEETTEEAPAEVEADPGVQDVAEETREEPTERKTPPAAVAEVVEIKVRRKAVEEQATSSPTVRFRRGGLRRRSSTVEAVSETPVKEEVVAPTEEKAPNHESVPVMEEPVSLTKLLYRLHEVEAELGAANNKLTKVTQQLDSLSRDTSAKELIVITKQVELANALLFVINNAVLDEGDSIDSLKDLTK